MAGKGAKGAGVENPEGLGLKGFRGAKARAEKTCWNFWAPSTSCPQKENPVDGWMGKSATSQGHGGRPKPLGNGPRRGAEAGYCIGGAEAGNCIGGPEPVTYVLYVQRKPRRQSSSLLQPRLVLYSSQFPACTRSGTRSVT